MYKWGAQAHAAPGFHHPLVCDVKNEKEMQFEWKKMQVNKDNATPVGNPSLIRVDFCNFLKCSK